MTQDELAALDRAATQGVPITGHDWLRQFANDRGLADALLALYRTGKLVLIDDHAVERCARAMCLAGGYDPNEIMSNDGPRWRYYEEGTTAALAALGVK